jgi:hypothetical protein
VEQEEVLVITQLVVQEAQVVMVAVVEVVVPELLEVEVVMVDQEWLPLFVGDYLLSVYIFFRFCNGRFFFTTFTN